MASSFRDRKEDIPSPFNEAFNMYAVEDVKIKNLIDIVKSERCEIYLNCIWPDFSHILKNERTE